MNPLLVVLSSPSGGGKTTIARRIVSQRPDCGYSISATTRAPRGTEADGVHYHFLSPGRFEEGVQAGEFLEHAIYNGQRYGTLVSEVQRLLQTGKHVLLDIEVVGARLVRNAFPDAVLIFVVPPSGSELLRRLEGRGTESIPAMMGRLEQALEELSAVGEYDYLVTNDVLDESVRMVDAIIEAESRRIARQQGMVPQLDRLRTEVAAELSSLAVRRLQPE